MPPLWQRELAGIAALAVDVRRHQAILRWADGVKVKYGAELQDCFPEFFGTEVELAFVDGSRRIERVLNSRGAPVLPLSWEQIVEKASGLVATIRPALNLDRLQDVLKGLSVVADTSGLDALLTADQNI